MQNASGAPDEAFQYDEDGNLTQDGRWQYTWNGENRLIKAEELVSSTNRQPYAVYYAYDYRGRMIWKTIAPFTGSPIKTTTYLWDDYNIIAEHTTTADTTNTAFNVWGLDLSGALQGAGGVGGLLAVAQSGTGISPIICIPPAMRMAPLYYLNVLIAYDILERGLAGGRSTAYRLAACGGAR